MNIDRTSLIRLKYLLLTLYAIASFFPQTLRIPGLPGQVQATELLFLISAPFFFKELVHFIRCRPWFTAAGVLYGLANLASGYLSGSQASLLEAGGRIYLLLLACMVGGTYLRSPPGHQQSGQPFPKWAGDVPKLWAMVTIIICSGALLFYFSGSLGGPGLDRGVQLIRDYPYFGTVYRMSGTGSSYGMFCMLVLPGFLFGARKVLRGEWPWWYLITVILATLLTFAKENILFVMGVLLLPEAETYLRRRLRLSLASFLLVALYAVTHYMPLSAGNRVEGSEFVSDRIAWRINDNWRIIETNYVAHKRGALALFPAAPWLGLGPGEFQEHTAKLVPDGKYPEHLVGFNPHSAWTGALVETGLFGFLGLFFVCVSLWYYRPAEFTTIFVIFLLFLVASVFKDIMNFRGLWWLIGWYLSLQRSANPLLKESKRE